MLVLDGTLSSAAGADDKTKVHIVHLGERKHDDPELVTKSHHDILESLLGSKEAARQSIVYSYCHGFSGFAAKLTASQAKKLSDHPDVIHVVPNRILKLRTTRAWDYLGLSPSYPQGLLHKTNMGDDAIVGIIDTGVWPEYESFDDKGLGPIPKRWKGQCVSGDDSNATVHCNRKLIGARYYMDGLVAENGQPFNLTEQPEFISPRDYNGHGSHVAATAVGAFVPNTSYEGLAVGTARGGAPQARLAMYKACWGSGSCSSPDVVKALDQGIHDGVDVFSLSLGDGVPMDFEVDRKDIGIATFHAVMKGIPVVFAGGNAGPDPQTVDNVAPWAITVAATSMDRSFPTPITLGNNLTILADAFYVGPEVGFTDLVSADDLDDSSLVKGKLDGKVVLVFYADDVRRDRAYTIRKAGCAGIIYAEIPTDLVDSCEFNSFPCISVDYEVGTDILYYIQSTSSPKVKISPSKTYVGQPVATKVAKFSSRGPNSLSPAILKPDIAAPGVSILSAMPQGGSIKYRMISGTSMATPFVSGIVALLKLKHPDWSPAAIRSALVTTARRTDPFGQPIFGEGSNHANPLDYGGGLVNPEQASDPGLVYDMGAADYTHYLCSAGYEDKSISNLLGSNYTCPTPKPSMLDVNMPSITIPDLKEEVTLTRTVTNVGPDKTVYRAVVEHPRGIELVVKPSILIFTPTIKKATFSVTVSTTYKVNTDYCFGSLTWTDQSHNVTIPVSVKTKLLKTYF